MNALKLTEVLKRLTPNTKHVSLELIAKDKLNLDEVVELSPPFCSITWLDSNLTDLENHSSVSLARKLLDRNLNVILHLPGRIFDKSTAGKLLEIAKNIGVRNILALQGEYSLWKDTQKEDFPYAKDLVRFVRETYGDHFCVGVTGYPSGHPRVATLELDTEYLKQKTEAGADFIITQAIFDVKTLKDFAERCKNNDIDLPIIPGVFIIDTHKSLTHMIRLCKLTLPDDVQKFLNDNKAKDDVIKKYGIEACVKIITSLLNESENNVKASCVHVFTMNNLRNVKDVLKKLNEM